MLLPDARHGNAAKQYDYHRNCNLPQSNPALSPGRFRPYAFLTAPLSACMLQSLLFPTHMAVRLSAGFLQIGLTVYFQQKRFYRIVRTAEGQLPDSDNIASGPYHFHSVHKRILLFPVLLAIPGGKRQLPDTGMLQFGFALIGMAVAGQDEFKDFSGRSVSGSVLTLQTTSSIFSAGSTQTFIVEQVRIFPPVMARTEGRVTQPAFLKRTM